MASGSSPHMVGHTKDEECSDSACPCGSWFWSIHKCCGYLSASKEKHSDSDNAKPAKHFLHFLPAFFLFPMWCRWFFGSVDAFPPRHRGGGLHTSWCGSHPGQPGASRWPSSMMFPTQTEISCLLQKQTESCEEKLERYSMRFHRPKMSFVLKHTSITLW